MRKVKRIELEGFRGALAPLTLDLTKGGQPVSTVIYGRNGTGKSSVTDAWEWLLTGRIEHLRREGAGASSYPHFAAIPNRTWVSIALTGEAGDITAHFDADRITQPRISGDLAALKQLTPHPCHIRFADLAQFVFMTKTERYDMLTKFMGLARQIEIQKALRRTQRQFREHVDTLATKRRELIAQVAAKLGGPCSTLGEVVTTLGPLLRRQSLTAPTSIEELRTIVVRMREVVAADPRAAELAQHTDVARKLKEVGSAGAAAETLEHFAIRAQPFADLAEQLRALALLSLLESGREAVVTSGDAGTCPLCGQAFPGDLALHINSELEKLRALKAAHTQTTTALNGARAALRAVSIVPNALATLVPELPYPALKAILQPVVSSGNEVQEQVNAILQALPKTAEEFSAATLQLCTDDASRVKAAQAEFEVAAEAAITAVEAIVLKLQADDTRLQLVQDFELLNAAVDALPNIEHLQIATAKGESLVTELESDVEDYVRACIEDVRARFDQISDDVAVYFAVLEELTPGLASPALRILEDQDRSVVFEVELHGHLASPAYKYLSESQLNSFGLAVFLASVRHFNPHFGFLILDDVVNSLDGHKRPQLLKLLRLHFADRQVLLLTHDSSWRDRIARELPQWKRLHFRRLEPGVGPILESPPTSLETVQEHLHRDEAKVAGQILGPLIEDELQEFSEATEVELKFNRRNEYTLEPLLAGLRRRLESKLRPQHPAAMAAKALAENAGFRNLCAHAKNPAIDITPQEVQLALDAWLALATHLRCSIETCNDVLHWDDPDFRCGCGATVLRKAL